MKDMEITETSPGEPPPNPCYLSFKWVVSSSKKSTQSSRFSLSTSPAPLFCFSLPKISPFFKPPVLFLFMQASYAPCSCSDHHFLISPFNHLPSQLLICSIASTVAMASGWSHPCHTSPACSFMEVVPHFKTNIFKSSWGDIKCPLVLLIKAIIINTRVGLQKKRVYRRPKPNLWGKTII